MPSSSPSNWRTRMVDGAGWPATTRGFTSHDSAITIGVTTSAKPSASRMVSAGLARGRRTITVASRARPGYEPPG